MTAITKMFLSSSYSLSKNSHPRCVVFKIGCALIRSAAAEESLLWIHHCAVFAERLWSPTLCKNRVTESKSTAVADTGDSGIPRHRVVLHSVHHGFPQFRNEIIFKGRRDSNFKPGLVPLFPAPPYNHTRNITHSLCVCVCVCQCVCVFAWAHGCTCLCVIAHCGIKGRARRSQTGLQVIVAK